MFFWKSDRLEKEIATLRAEVVYLHDRVAQLEQRRIVVSWVNHEPDDEDTTEIVVDEGGENYGD